MLYLVTVYNVAAGDAFYDAELLADINDDKFVFGGELAELEEIIPSVDYDGLVNWDTEPLDPAITREGYRAEEMSAAASLLRKYCWSNPEVVEFLNTL